MRHEISIAHRRTVKRSRQRVQMRESRVFAYLISTNVLWRLPVVQRPVPDVGAQATAVSANVDRIARAWSCTLRFFTENSAIGSNIGDVTTVWISCQNLQRRARSIKAHSTLVRTNDSDDQGLAEHEL